MKKSVYVKTDNGNVGTLLATDSRNELPHYVQLKNGEAVWCKDYSHITEDEHRDHVEPTKTKPAAKKKAAK